MRTSKRPAQGTRSASVGMGYRDASPDEPRIAVVEYRPHPLVSMVLLAAMLAVIPVAMGALATQHGREVVVTCERSGQHTCDVARDYVLFTTHELVPIGSIAQVYTTAHQTKNVTRYVVTFATATGPVGLMRPLDRAHAETVRAALSGYLENGTEYMRVVAQPRSTIPASLFALVALLTSFLPLLVTRTARIELELDRGRLRYRRQRWPLPPARRTLPLEHVEGAVVRTRTGSKGGTIYEAALLLVGQPDLILVPHASGAETNARETVDEINRLLATMRA